MENFYSYLFKINPVIDTGTLLSTSLLGLNWQRACISYMRIDNQGLP